ncbi:2-succinyl-6-hydroxy-2,4-cyclohexadiene-1-carboxylate synthase [Microcoleus sp. FACHB-672]|uniref:2-succinyl-6-hydroxy-2, 4-cyclohexadiene-1-carboxylate synthase n=1 Tax=Microcoleus sp. FACHB-672 TaxID=2692825 RepID=UPI001682DF35|nr:2-succinyl-6-hydroxy-2,4-cyclohexadiene-1-carboxylate synthase [Microcoleus sp. FACHB-672]MBD2039573.1 2-succinyl-6-hydroxy-2,4-cyclohexadiene-1-carboxylate synthase [Microcoleus sp. FACHB-672]
MSIISSREGLSAGIAIGKREGFNPYQFHYSLIGSLNQPVILFLHGFMGDSNDFSEIISMLCEQFCCLAVDLPGHGKTLINGTSECYTMPNTALGLINLLDNLKIEKCFLAGYSMGGRLALYLTLHFPSRFEKVILESTSPGLKTAEERTQRIQIDWEWARELETKDFKDFLLNWYKQSLFKTLQTHPNFDKLIERRLQNNPLELAKSLRQMGTGNQPSLWDKIADNKIPVRFLGGEYDDKFKCINAEMATLCQVSKLRIITKTGHNIHFENPKAYIEILSNFFRV